MMIPIPSALWTSQVQLAGINNPESTDRLVNEIVPPINDITEESQSSPSQDEVEETEGKAVTTSGVSLLSKNIILRRGQKA